MAYSALQMAEAFINAGELSDALDALNQHLTRNPRDEDALRLKANVLARSDDLALWQEAILSLKGLKVLFPDDLILLSVLLEKTGQIDEALTALDARYKQHERIAERYVHLLQGLREYAAAGRVAAAMIEKLPDSWRWLQWAGDLAVQDANLDAALKHYNAALGLITSRFDIENGGHMAAVAARVMVARAEIYRKQHLFDQAEADLMRASTIISGDPVIEFKRGLIAFERGQQSAARSLCESALEAASPTLRSSMLDAACELSPTLHDLLI